MTALRAELKLDFTAHTPLLETVAVEVQPMLAEFMDLDGPAVGRQLDLLLLSPTPDALTTYAKQIAELRQQEAHQCFSGHLDQSLPLHQREKAPGGGGSQGIGEREVLQHQGITGLEDRRAEDLSLLLAARRGACRTHPRESCMT